MKGVILAGGNDDKLSPLTQVTNKHLLPVYDQPMIYYAIKSLTKAGIKDIMIISGSNHAGHFLNLLGSGKEFNANFSYAIQEESRGIAQALELAQDFADNDKIIVILGDNIIEDDISSAVEDFKTKTMGAKIFLKDVENPNFYGVAKIDGDKISEIIEKPKKFVSSLAVAGLYMYDNQVWDIIKQLELSNRDHFEITDVNNFYIQQGTMSYEDIHGYWLDCGASINNLMRASIKLSKMQVAPKDNLSDAALKIVENTTQKIVEETLKIVNQKGSIIVKKAIKEQEIDLNDFNQKIKEVNQEINQIPEKTPETLNKKEEIDEIQEPEKLNDIARIIKERAQKAQLESLNKPKVEESNIEKIKESLIQKETLENNETEVKEEINFNIQSISEIPDNKKDSEIIKPESIEEDPSRIKPQPVFQNEKTLADILGDDNSNEKTSLSDYYLD